MLQHDLTVTLEDDRTYVLAIDREKLVRFLRRRALRSVHGRTVTCGGAVALSVRLHDYRFKEPQTGSSVDLLA